MNKGQAKDRLPRFCVICHASCTRAGERGGSCNLWRMLSLRVCASEDQKDLAMRKMYARRLLPPRLPRW